MNETETATLITALRRSADAEVVTAIEQWVREGPDHGLCRINALAFAAERERKVVSIPAG